MNNYETIEQTKEKHRGGLREPDVIWPKKIRLATTCIHTNLFAQKLKVAWVMSQCLVSNHNFSSKFAYYVGQAPKKYILHHRIVVAKKLFSNTKLSSITIATIAFELGFLKTSTFSKAFKHKAGLPPGQWRNRKS